MEQEKKCKNCKWADMENANYCYCRKKRNRVRLSGVENCAKFEPKVLIKL